MGKIQNIIDALNTDVLEKEEVIAVSLLAALAGQNIFLLGPPGTAKSLISRRLSSVFETQSYFEYLMQRFSTPEEIFGPISLKELKEDNYVRKTEGYLPDADFAFLDEIWKSSPAVLNTLLTVINEKKFRNGKSIKEVPLKILISASNETPPEGQGLEALYDRFLVRLVVPPTERNENFESIIQNKPAQSAVNIAEKVTNEEFEKWQLEIDQVQLSPETINIIHGIRNEVEKGNEKNKKQKIYISDRRWQKAARFLKAAAFFCNRKKTNHVDTLLLRHCLWSDDSNGESLTKIVEEEVRKNGFENDISFNELEKKKNALEKEVEKELYYTKDIYKTTKLSGSDGDYLEDSIRYSRHNEYHVIRDPANYSKTQEYFIPITMMATDKEFHPVDESGNELEFITCNFKGQNSFSTQVNNNSIYLSHLEKGSRMYKSIRKSPTIQFNKGDVKREVNKRLFNSLIKSVNKLFDDIEMTILEIEEKKEMLQKQLDSPFVPENMRNIAIESVEKQLERVRVVKSNCELLQSKVSEAEKAQ